ncbi:MAG: beta-CASP ribonuclease aCPSF1 [Candidatus Aenigmarchaeota archaeon]|nr:beta-CASP ribonuclease aCPSF1 [Candidatus Aenigmarchaeota archaeon]
MKIKEEVKNGLPSSADISEICFEGSEIVVYVKNKDFFIKNGSSVKELVSKLKKRIVVRPDISITTDMETAKEKIKEIVPKEAGIDEITFEPAFGRLTIEAQKPGLVIGKGGETLKKIKKETVWFPVVKRAPAIPSEVVQTIRKVIFNESEYRKKFLNKLGEKIHSAEKKDIDWIRVGFLGSAREVGRSTLLLQTPGSNILLDCGVKPSGDEFPYLDAPEFDIKKLDGVVLSHAHLDHSGFIPYLYAYGYDGPVYCTPPTRDLFVLLCLDYIDVAQREGRKVPYSKKDIENAVKHSVVLNFDEVSDITPDMRITFQNAGHILGSSLVHIHLGEGLHNIVYTGDFKFGKSRLFNPTFTQFQRVETLIMESTYGGSDDIQPPREEAEKKLVETVMRTLKNGGKVLIPSFAVGRAQEVMCILADIPDFNYPVYLEGMLWDATAIHTTYPEYLNKNIQHKIFHKGENPFLKPIFKRVGSAEERREILQSTKPYVVIATSGMLIGGPAIEYLKSFAEDPRNTLIFVGYQAEGTFGRKIQKGWTEMPVADEKGRRNVLQIKLNVETVEGLSGHSDRNQLINYVYKLADKPKKIILNHGEESKSIDLARSLHKLFKYETVVPRNLEIIRLK